MANSIDQKTAEALREYRIEQLEKQLEKLESLGNEQRESTQSLLGSTVSAQSELYSNHLDTLSVAGALIVVAAGIVMFFLNRWGFKYIQEKVDKRIDDEIKTNTQEFAELHNELKVLHRELKEQAERQKEKDKIYQAIQFYNEAERLYDKKDYLNATIKYTKAIELDPENMGYYTDRGIARIRAGALDDSLADFDAVIHKQPRNPYAHYNKACALALLGSNASALQTLILAIDFEESYKTAAKQDEDFVSLRDNPDFRSLVGL